ncbi:large ribosomal subunit protein mL63 [Temnothorax nylanderi]|uniref:large ribosomal subunit protein mL63 n=1 Tax=Temnothorax nylanderi TaxID=102681 RepID=UPI003A83F3B4
MRLGLTLLGYVCRIPYRYRGKYRKVKKPSMHDLLKMKQDFEREEQNMLILRHPYLTVEQSSGHMKDLIGDRKDNFLKKIYGEKDAKFQREITIAERLCHMRVTEAWD